MRAAGAQYKWDLNHGSIALLCRGGGIIHSRFPDGIRDAFAAKQPPANLLLAPYLRAAVRAAQTHNA